MKASGTGYTGTRRLALYGEEHDALRESVRRQLASRRADAEAVEEQKGTPGPLLRSLAGDGLFGLKFGTEIGGSGPDHVADVVVTHEVSLALPAGVAAAWHAHVQLALPVLEASQQRPDLAALLASGIDGTSLGTVVGGLPGSAARGPGSGVEVRSDGQDVVLSGSANLVVNGQDAQWFVVSTNPSAEGTSRVFLVQREELDAAPADALGLASAGLSTVTFDDVRVPSTAELELTSAARHRLRTWDLISRSFGATAMTQAILNGAIAYSEDRSVFGRPLASYQVWRHRFADIAVDVELSRALCEQALRLFLTGDQGHETALQARLLSHRLAHVAADEAVQVHGGYGYLTEYAAQRYWRDSRLGALLDGGDDLVLDELHQLVHASPAARGDGWRP